MKESTILLDFRGLRGETEQGLQILNGPFDCTLKTGEIGAFIGKNKGHDLFLLLLGVGNITGGECSICHEKFTSKKRMTSSTEIFKEIGFCFKNFGLFSNKSLLENIDLPARYHGLYGKKGAGGELAIKALQELNIDEREWHKRPDSVSEYIKKKVLLARSIVLNPKILLLVDPLSGIPWSGFVDLMKWILLQKEKGRGIFICTDNDPFAYSLGDWAWKEKWGIISKKSFPTVDQRSVEMANILREGL